MCWSGGGDGFVVQMPAGEFAPRLGKCAEVGEGLHGGDAREFLAEVINPHPK